MFMEMHYRSFGYAGSVPVIGQGTGKLECTDRTTAIAVLRRGLELGMTHIDTAEFYGWGDVEVLVGEAIAGHRDEVFLVSKVVPEHASYEGTLRACENSLRRLRTDRLDSYLLHWRGQEPLEETLSAFEELARSCKILSWGVSNFDVEDLEIALSIVGAGRIACNQVLYHLGERGVEDAVLPWCARHGVALVAYSPLSAGRFPSASTPQGRTLAEVASSHDATSRQVALAFLLREPTVIVIPKASQIAHLEEVAMAGNVQLDDSEILKLDSAFPRRPCPRLRTSQDEVA